MLADVLKTTFPAQDHQDQTEQLKQLREKNKEVVKENAG
jgi:hypothetical protein